MATLEQLRDARDRLLTGQRVVTVSSAGRSTTYAEADLKDIERRIRELETEAGAQRTSIVQVRSKKGW